jgi:hypothetical protein
MLTFIKRLLGLTPNPVKTAEEVKAIFIPQMTTAPVNKVPAISESGAEAVAAAIAPKSANKRRRPRNRNKVRAGGGTVAKINQAKPAVSEGKTKGGNGAVKPAQVAKAKPAKPKAPVKK